MVILLLYLILSTSLLSTSGKVSSFENGRMCWKKHSQPIWSDQWCIPWVQKKINSGKERSGVGGFCKCNSWKPGKVFHIQPQRPYNAELGWRPNIHWTSLFNQFWNLHPRPDLLHVELHPCGIANVISESDGESKRKPLLYNGDDWSGRIGCSSRSLQQRWEIQFPGTIYLQM